MSTGTTLARLIGSGPLLLDFDGPVCSVFAGYPAPRVAAELIALLDAEGITLPPEVRGECDPLAILRWTGDACTPGGIRTVEEALCAAELRAVGTAEPTPYAREVILGARARGLSVAVVSNNSAAAIEAYLMAHDLTSYIAPVIGRAYADPKRMKPSPEPVLAAIRALEAAPSRCTLIGDSLTDVEAARAASVAVVGYANRPWKVEALAAADAIVTSMEEIADEVFPVSTESPRENIP